MTPIQALEMMSKACAEYRGTKADHIQLGIAETIVKQALEELWKPTTSSGQVSSEQVSS